MKIEMTVTSLRIGSDSLMQEIGEMPDCGQITLLTAPDKDDPWSMKSPSGYATINCSGDLARTFKIGDKFSLIRED
jgi:hypothetical protein